MPHPFLTEEDKAWPNNLYFYTDTSTDTDQEIDVSPHQTTVVITLSDGTDTATALVNLPPISKMLKGKAYTIIGKDVAGGITVRTSLGASFDDSPDWTDKAINADNDMAVFMRSGERIVEVEDRYT